MNRTDVQTATVVVEPVDLRLPIDRAVVSFARAEASAILESSLDTSGYGRWSIFACDPADRFVHPHTPGTGPPASGFYPHPRGVYPQPQEIPPFRGLADRIRAVPVATRPPADVPFGGGWIGFISYEAGLSIEGIPTRHDPDATLPLMAFSLYDAVALFNHRSREWFVAGIDWPAPMKHRRPSVGDRLESMRHRLAVAAALPDPPPPPEPDAVDVRSDIPRGAYFDKVKRAKRYIEAGDIYQVNLTQRFSARTTLTPLDIYRRLRIVSPSAYGAYLPCGSATILSSSPELFFDLRDRSVVTRPIKGTRPRVGIERLDRVYRCQLATCEKERAELTMIVDLLRNDLGRVCAHGSVRVREEGKIEVHPTVFHRVATIGGTLADGRDGMDLLRACYPGGSITGAPKIRAMQIIDELEPAPRGVYCGSIGWIGVDGAMSLNIAIRTMVCSGDHAYIHAGGAIVADSTPAQEYDETLAKAAGMLRAIGGERAVLGTSDSLEEVTA